MPTYLIVAVAIEFAVVVTVGLAWVRARNARSVADACNFPGCIAAREELRGLADKHNAIPREDVLAVVENVEKRERRP